MYGAHVNNIERKQWNVYSIRPHDLRNIPLVSSIYRSVCLFMNFSSKIVYSKIWTNIWLPFLMVLTINERRWRNKMVLSFFNSKREHLHSWLGCVENPLWPIKRASIVEYTNQSKFESHTRTADTKYMIFLSIAFSYARTRLGQKKNITDI